MTAKDLAHELSREWRVWFLITALIGAGLAIGPHYAEEEVRIGPNQVENQTTIATNINMGLDLQGGARVMVEPNLTGIPVDEHGDTVDNIITTLNTRVEAFGLQDVTIRPVSSLTSNQRRIQVEMAGASTEELRNLVESQGRFEAAFSIQASDGDTLTFEDSVFNVEETENGLSINGTAFDTGETITLQTDSHNITLRYHNQTEAFHALRAVGYTGQDVSNVDINPTQSGVQCSSPNSCQFQFQVQLDQRAAERFTAVAQNFEGPSGGNLQGTQLVLTLDGQEMNRLSVSTGFRDSVISTPSITGGGESRAQATEEMDNLKSILQSGALPTEIDIVSTNSVSATLGQEFVRVAFIAIVLAIIGVAFTVFIRYQTPKIALPITITGLSEVLLLVAVFSNTSLTIPIVLALLIPTGIGLYVGFKQAEFTVLMLPVGTLFLLGIFEFAPSLDLAGIAGIIAAVGTGINDQIIITDERKEERVKSIKKRIKRAFFIIFTSAASTIGAMLPLMSIGAGAVAGFAVTTIIGVLIGVAVTRPAYAKILETLDV
ncbi:MAG: hypothetical protein MUP66_01845 [Candidatus Nanohaloarchaeota archaeon QJJ-5]|nr:hypothetical protein [Candidatus Nanohaloarchaeota archaeon QJJ-5]